MVNLANNFNKYDEESKINDNFVILQKKSISNLKNAKQTLEFTYEMVKENKLLLSVVDELFLACTNAMGSLLYYELKHKRINSFENKFEPKLRIFRNEVMERYGIGVEVVKLMRDLKEIIIAHKKSPFEFSREDKFVICSDNYDLKQITKQNLQEALKKANIFIDEVIYITSYK